MGVAPSTSQAIFACGGVGESSIYEGRRPRFFLCPHFPSRDNDACAVGITKSESDIVQVILRQLPERYNIVKLMTLADPQLTRTRLEYIIRSAYSQRKAHEIAKQGPAMYAPAEPPNPHALVVGRGFRDGGGMGGGGQRRDDGMVSRGGGIPRQQQQLLHHWSRGGGTLRQQQQLQQHWPRDGGMPRQQQQQQHWSRGGGMPRQQQQPQQWSRGGGIPHQHQRSSHVFPPARQDNNNSCSNRQGESLRSEVRGRTEVAPFLKLFSAVMAGLLSRGISRTI